jgi:hypothetical protein
MSPKAKPKAMPKSKGITKCKPPTHASRALQLAAEAESMHLASLIHSNPFPDAVTAGGHGLANPDHGLANNEQWHRDFIHHWRRHLTAVSTGLEYLNLRVSGHAENSTHQNLTLAMFLQRNLKDAFLCFEQADGEWQQVQAMIDAKKLRIAELLG